MQYVSELRGEGKVGKLGGYLSTRIRPVSVCKDLPLQFCDTLRVRNWKWALEEAATPPPCESQFVGTATPPPCPSISQFKVSHRGAIALMSKLRGAGDNIGDSSCLDSSNIPWVRSHIQVPKHKTHQTYRENSKVWTNEFRPTSWVFPGVSCPSPILQTGSSEAIHPMQINIWYSLKGHETFQGLYCIRLDSASADLAAACGES